MNSLASPTPTAQAPLDEHFKFFAAVLHKLSQQAAARLVTYGASSSFFNDGEHGALVNACAAVLAYADLSGRKRIRDMHAAKLRKLALPVAESALVDAMRSSLQKWRSLREDVTPVPPERALANFRALTPTIGTDPQRFGADMRRRAFTMAAAAGTQLLTNVQGYITTALQTGERFGNAASDIDRLLSQAGVTPRNPQYAEMVFRTNVKDAYAAAATQELQDPDVSEAFPVWQYVGIEDGRQRHTQQDGNHQSFFDKYYPTAVAFVRVRDSIAVSPWNCRCDQIPIDKWEWNDLKKGGARIADGYPDVPSIDELAARSPTQNSAAVDRPTQDPPAPADLPAPTFIVPSSPPVVTPQNVAMPAAPPNQPTGPRELHLSVYPDSVHAAVIGRDGVPTIAVVKPGDTFAGTSYDDLRAMGSGRVTLPPDGGGLGASPPLQIAGPVDQSATPAGRLVTIATNYQSMAYGDIDKAVVDVFAPLTAAQAKSLAAQSGVATATGRADAIRRITAMIRDRKESFDRVSAINLGPVAAQQRATAASDAAMPIREPQTPAGFLPGPAYSVQIAVDGGGEVVRVQTFGGGNPVMQIVRGDTFLGWTHAELRGLGTGLHRLRAKSV